MAGLPRAVSPTYVACRGNRRLFAAEVLGFVGRESAVVLGHVNLSPLGLGFSRFGVIAHGTDVWSPLPILRRWSLQRSTVAAGVSEDTLRKLCAVQGVGQIAVSGSSMRSMNRAWHWRQRPQRPPVNRRCGCELWRLHGCGSANPKASIW